MNAIKHLKRVSPLAAVFVALAVVLALTPSAHAQSTLTGQLDSTGLAPGYSASAAPPAVSLQLDNEADFNQRWQRVTVTPSVFRFTRAGQVSCMRSPEFLPADQSAAIVLGGCLGYHAQWRQISVPGVGDAYVNVATGHYLSPPICLFTCDNRLLALNDSTARALGLPMLRWYFDVI
jgi:hypothetical protein